MSDNLEDKTDLFLRLLMTHQSRLFAYLLALVSNYSDAEDILQELTVTLLHQFDKFTPGTNFLAWARTIAFYEVMKYRKKQPRQMKFFSEETLKSIADFCENNPASSDLMIEAAEQCIQKLPDRDKQLVILRYSQDATTKNIADRLGISIYSVYRAIERIHNVLLRCIRRVLSAEH